jgi:hypothetical protein
MYGRMSYERQHNKRQDKASQGNTTPQENATPQDVPHSTHEVLLLWITRLMSI